MITTNLMRKEPTREEMDLITKTLKHYDVLSAERVTLDENTGEEKQYVKVSFKEQSLNMSNFENDLAVDNWFIAYLEKAANLTMYLRHMHSYTGVTFRGDNPV